MDLLHALTLLNEQSIAVNGLLSSTSSILIHLSNLQDILKAIKGDLDDLVVRTGQEIAERLDATLVNQVADLLRLLQTARRCIRDCPASLLSGLQIAIGKEMDKGRNDVGIDDSLDLSRVASCNIGDSPTGLFADSVFSRAQER